MKYIVRYSPLGYTYDELPEKAADRIRMKAKYFREGLDRDEPVLYVGRIENAMPLKQELFPYQWTPEPITSIRDKVAALAVKMK